MVTQQQPVQPGQQGASMNPETFSEGGGPPVQKNLRIISASYEYFDYEGKANRTMAAKLDLVDDAGQSYTQRYSVGDPTRWSPSPDGKFAIPMVQGAVITKQCNFGILLAALVNAGFPKEQLGADISVLNGLYAYWDGVPEPEGRNAMRAPDQQQRVRIILVPFQILQANGAAGGAPPPVAAMPPGMQAQAPAPAAPIQAVATSPIAAPPQAAAPPIATTPAAAAPDAGAASILASIAKVSAANNGVFTLQHIFPQVQADYPAEAMTLLPQVPNVLAANGYQVDPQTQNVLKVT